MNVFVTGATGFLGRRFLRKLLQIDPIKTYITLRPKPGHSLTERLLQMGLARDPRVLPVELDIAAPLDSSDSGSLPADIDELWHIAGLTDFHESKREQLFEANVRGTRTAIRLAKQTNAKRYFHISTAYVSGLATGTVLEDEIMTAPKFRNAYEETKYEAELLVRESGLPFIIIRPSIIMGDSTTGETDSDKMVYGVLKTYHAISRLVNREDMDGHGIEMLKYYVQGNPLAEKNLICVDDVVRLMLEIRRRGEIGKTYHCTNPHGTPIGRLHEVAVDRLGIHCLRMKPDFSLSKDRKQAFINRGLGVYRDYMFHSDPIFSQTNTRRVNGRAPVAMTPRLVRLLFDAYLEGLDGTKGRCQASDVERSFFSGLPG